MKKYIGFVIVFFFLMDALTPLFCAAKELADKEIIIDSISINSERISDDELKTEQIILSTTDTIAVYFRIKVNRGERSSFVFRRTLRNFLLNVSNSQTQSSPEFKYSNLSEGSYEVILDVVGSNWQVEPVAISFRVDNYIAAMKNDLRKMKKQVALKDTTAKDTSLQSEINSYFNIFSILFGFTIAIPILVFVYFRTKKATKIKSSEISKGKAKMEETSTSQNKEQFDKLVAENSNLRAEIAALRGQIDAMQTRSEDLRKQNQDLKDTADKLARTQGEFEDLQKQKDELFAIIIHDLKNPVALVKSLVELLRSYDLTVTEQKDIIDDIFETTSKIVALSQEVSRILALESSAMRLNFYPAQINEILKDIYRRNLVASNNKSIEVLLDLSDTIPESQMDSQKVEEIIDNLLSNALKFSHQRGQVRIKSHKSDDNIVVEISDNGLGLSEDDVKLAFQRGGRLSAQPTAGEPSSGFGLWIVKKLVEAHHGRVWVKSALGKGSTFAFSIPITTASDNNN